MVQRKDISILCQDKWCYRQKTPSKLRLKFSLNNQTSTYCYTLLNIKSWSTFQLCTGQNIVPHSKIKKKNMKFSKRFSHRIKNSFESMLFSKWSSPFFKFLKSFSPFLCHFATSSREYYKWLNSLRRQIQIGRLPVQTRWAFWQA